MFRRNKPAITILKHHRSSSVYIDGRYLVVESRTSLRSKRGREIAIETSQAIHRAVFEAMPSGFPPMESAARTDDEIDRDESRFAAPGADAIDDDHGDGDRLGARVRDQEGRD